MSARSELAQAILSGRVDRAIASRDGRLPLRVLVTAAGQDDLLLDADPDYRFDVEDSDVGFRFRGIPLVRRDGDGPSFELVWPAPPEVVRVDRYTVNVNGLAVRADAAQEMALQGMTAEQAARFTRIMGGRS